jgi:hypothetical protein
MRDGESNECEASSVGLGNESNQRHRRSLNHTDEEKPMIEAERRLDQALN